MRFKSGLLAAAAIGALAGAAAADDETAEAGAGASERTGVDEVVIVTARRVAEDLQDVPIPVSVISGQLLSDSGTLNATQIEQLVPTLQIYSSNPRNTALNIRGLGTTFGLTNDGV